MSYKNLEIWELSRSIIIEVQHMTLAQLPKYEMFEEGSQIRRSIKSVRSNIVEGYGRRRYKKDCPLSSKRTSLSRRWKKPG